MAQCLLRRDLVHLAAILVADPSATAYKGGHIHSWQTLQMLRQLLLDGTLAMQGMRGNAPASVRQFQQAPSYADDAAITGAPARQLSVLQDEVGAPHGRSGAAECAFCWC